MKWLLFLFMNFIILGVYAQKEDILVEEDSVKVHSPKKASRLSLILPGAGQVYNSLAMPKGKKHAWWKVPIIYAGLGATAYLFVENQILQRDYKQEYINRVELEMDPSSELAAFDNAALIQLHETHKSSRNTMAIGFLAVYGLNVLDALVEAHFVDFDVSEDLSLMVRPAIMQNNSFGITLALRLK